MDAAATHRTINAVWRIESARIIGALARRVRDVGLAEELAQDALLAALEQWPREGIPDNPAAWLTAAAKHRAIDLLRKRTLHAHKEGEIAREIDARHAIAAADFADAVDAALDDQVGDDLLRLVFTACHPVLSPEARVALTLRLLGGLTTDEIARSFLVPEATIAQRIVRAKRTLAAARVPFEAPRGHELGARLSSVLEVELNRAVALSMAFGPAVGLEHVDALRSEPQLKGYHLLPSVRGDLLAKLGRNAEACEAFKRAAELTRNARERKLLLMRAQACAGG
jgi:RNA polymerase sigma factor (sigma-70 family)